MTINVTVNATGADGYVYEGMKNSPQPLKTKVSRGEKRDFIIHQDKVLVVAEEYIEV
jgi:hypothetical protein